MTEKRLRNTTPPELDGSVSNAELESELDEPVTNPRLRSAMVRGLFIS